MAGFPKSLFGASSAPDKPTPPMPPIEQMSFEQILAHIRTLHGEMPLRFASSILRRLYEIALYDHHVPTEQRKDAYQLLESFKADLEKGLADNPDAIEALRNGNSRMENDVRHTGVGSLAWMIQEYDVPTDEIVPYVMRPEHGHLLGDFLETLEPTAVETIRPQLVRHLILSRRYDNSGNAVLILHGLAAKADKATGAIFTAEERATLLGVPDDYSAGRKILVNLGLLPGPSNVRPFNPALDKESLVSVMAGVLKERADASRVDPRLENLTDERRYVTLLALLMLSSHLMRRILRQIYGSDVSASLLAIHTLDSQKQILEKFDEMADKLAAKDPVPPIDVMLFYAVMEMDGLAPETDGDLEREKKWMDMGAEWLNHERVELQDYLRSLLRFMSDAAHPEIRSIADKEIVHLINEVYARKGAQAGIAERVNLYFEDWIGTDA